MQYTDLFDLLGIIDEEEEIVLIDSNGNSLVDCFNSNYQPLLKQFWGRKVEKIKTKTMTRSKDLKTVSYLEITLK